MNRTFPTALFGLVFLLAPGVRAASSVTVPEGYMNFTIPAGSAAAPSVFTFSLPLAPAVPSTFTGQATGAISSVSSSTITNNSAGWSPGALSVKSSPYFVRVTSGAATGRTLLISSSEANTATTLTVNNQGTPLDGLGILAGDTYEIFPAYTLSSVFGSSVLGGATADAADVVRLNDGSGWVEYYYNTTAGEWRIGSIPVSQNDVVLRPDSGILFYRRGATPIALTLIGRVPSTSLQIVMNEVGTAFVAGFPFAQTLGQSDYNSMPGWVNSTSSVADADKVTAFVAGAWNSYNFNQAAGQWRNGSVPVNQGSLVSLSAGTPVIIESPTGTPGLKIWTRTLPYSLSAN